MTIGRKICGIIVIAVALCLFICAAFLFAPAADAENPAPVTLTQDSVFAVSATHIAYTSDNTLSIVDISYSSDPRTVTSAFEGEAVDIEITSNKIAVLSRTDNSCKLLIFPYDENGISEPVSASVSSSVLASSVCLSTDGEDILLLTHEWLYNISTGADNGSHRVTAGDTTTYADSTAFVFTDTVYFSKDSGVYFYDGGAADNNAVKSLFSPSLLSSVRGLAVSDGLLYLSAENGVFVTKEPLSAKPNDSISIVKLSGMSYASAIDIEGEYLYAFDKDALAIKRYTITSDNLVYNKCYDAEKYLAPTQFDLVQTLLPLEGDVITLYRSPRDLEVVAQVTGGIIALKQVSYDGGDGAASYYYCVTQDGEYGYVPSSASKLSEPQNPGYTAAQPLHGITQTPVYNFPYKASGELCTLSTDESGGVVMTKGEESAHVLLVAEGILTAGGESWCKVLIGVNDETLTGYMDARLICPYVSYSPAGVHDHCKINSGRAGVYVKLFTQPDENSQVAAELPDNTELMLASPYDENSAWTCVFYGDSTAYVLTENITMNALTTVQITLIAVLCVLAALGVMLGVVIYIKRKKKREYNEES